MSLQNLLWGIMQVGLIYLRSTSLGQPLLINPLSLPSQNCSLWVIFKIHSDIIILYTFSVDLLCQWLEMLAFPLSKMQDTKKYLANTDYSPMLIVVHGIYTIKTDLSPCIAFKNNVNYQRTEKWVLEMFPGLFHLCSSDGSAFMRDHKCFTLQSFPPDLCWIDKIQAFTRVPFCFLQKMET